MLRVHIERDGPRARYVIGHVLERMLGWPLEFVQDRAAFVRTPGPALYYGNDPPTAALHVPAQGLLGNTGLFPGPVPTGVMNDRPVLFPLSEGPDVFAATFLLLCLNEELLPHATDMHGRLPTEDRTLVQLGLHGTPIVDQWALDLAARLRDRYPEMPPPKRTYRHWVTIDVDNGMRFIGRPLWRQFAASIKGIALGRIRQEAQRWSVLAGRSPDPFDHYATWTERARSSSDRAIMFFLMRGGRRHDHASRASHPRMSQRIREVLRSGEVGIHPSYRSSEDHRLLAREVGGLRRISGGPVTASRQHFLRWRLPATLDALADEGITEDHSLGSSDRPGFMAGTCTPFRWYDPVKDREHPITIVPFAVMDSALHDRMHLGADDALAAMKRSSDAVREVGGTFVSVWHDRFLSGQGEWGAWPRLFDALLEHAQA